MRRVLFETFLGIILCIGGLCVGYVYIKSMPDGGNLFYLGLCIFLLGIGVFYLFRASKSDDTIIKKAPLDKNVSTVNKPEQENILERNNALISQWSKTIEQRDRLKMLEISGAGKEHNS